jgi:HEPN domain-containing protein
MVKEVKKSEAISYLKQANEFLDSARDSLAKGRFNAAGFNAIQAMINANDALTIYFLGKRASRDHKEAVRLHVDVVRVIGDSSCRNILKQGLDCRSGVGYLGISISKGNAERLTGNAIKFIDWVKKYVK